MIRIFTIAAALALCACASTPTYPPAAIAVAQGYSETQIESNRYFVSYRAASGADRSLVHDYALLRAADLALQSGRDWFWVDRRSFDGESSGRSGASVGVGVGGGSWGGRSGTFGSVGVNVPVGSGGGGTVRAATLEVRFGEGVKPDDANAYDARVIATNIRARLTP
jgi:hypothetical protein